MKHYDDVMVRFCAQECERQRTGPMEVYRMIRAYGLALNQTIVTMSFINDLALLIEPISNKNGFRNIPVIFSSGKHPAAKCDQILRLMQQLMLAYLDGDRLTPADFYYEFQKIHPFEDGNGRVGAIIYNHMRGTLDRPISAPDFFGPRS